MRSISLFAEDYGHEVVLAAMVNRVAASYGVPARVRSYSVRGGFAKVQAEFRQYVGDLLRFKEGLPDLVVLATDSNCQGYLSRRKTLQEAAEPIKDRVAYAIPDPHIERWLLRDPAAFKRALGAPCKPPDQKCDRNRYKGLLIQAVRDAGLAPLVGGMEHAEGIVAAMDLTATSADDDFGSFLQQLHGRFRLWSD